MSELEKKLAQKDKELQEKIEKGEIKVCDREDPCCDSCGA